MTTRQIPSAPFDQNAQNVISTDQDFTLNLGDDIVDVVGPGVTLTLPPNPVYGQRHRIIASGGNVSVLGNGHPIVGGGSFVFVFSALDLTFSVSNEWVPSLGVGPAGPKGATGATGSTGATGPSGGPPGPTAIRPGR